jgi:NAD(P)-dependent dehydrogenase (short-subunit alcohol dehydrogenase family)
MIRWEFSTSDETIIDVASMIGPGLPPSQSETHHEQIDVNLTGTCNAIRAVATPLVRNGGGRIIVTSSTQGRHGTKYGAAYSASKWGIIGLMKSAALEFGAHRITVNAVIPGLIDTRTVPDIMPEKERRN